MATNINNIDILTDRIKLLTNKKGTVSPSDAIHTTSTKYIQKTKLTEKRNQLQQSYADTKQMTHFFTQFSLMARKREIIH